MNRKEFSHGGIQKRLTTEFHGVLGEREEEKGVVRNLLSSSSLFSYSVKLRGLLFFLFVLVFASCNNFFNNLIPPDETRITSFWVDGQIGPASISGDTVTAEVAKGTERGSLIPTITVSPKASCIPLTLAYLSRTFPGADILQEATAIYQTRDLSTYVIDLIKRTPDFNVPVLDEPIDFTGPVQFLVIGGRGSIQQHTVNVIEESNDPILLGFSFAKYDNPELIRDAVGAINKTTSTVNVTVLYPVEMPLTYALIPSFEILGETLEVDGIAIQSGVDTIEFDKTLGTQTKTITVIRDGETADYTLSVEFIEDPDSIRSIIDFRFYKSGNPGIAANAVGSIMNSNATGAITVQVFYAGAKPDVLTPTFLSPGTVSVAGVTQTSGVSSQDFSQTLEYRVVSRNNLYTRTYTVRVDFIDVSAASPRITAFKFSAGINPELVQDTGGSISESAGLILITARYGGSSVPGPLVPEFQATGIVSVWGAVQISGLSTQDFSIQVKYTVTDPVNTLLKRDYWVQVSFTRDTSSDAKINAFSFHPDENSGLADEVEGRIDQNAGTITVFAPIGSGITARTMIPRFRAIGQVEVEGIAQTSGITGQRFDAPVVYEAVSANGINRKTYTVTVRELQTTIFVNQNAYGMGDGTSWQDAFRELRAACEAAAEFPEDVLKEIWIAAGTYKPSTSANSDEYFLLAANTNYIGGFAGSETAKSHRNVAANKVIISGELGGGVYSSNLFGAFNGNTAATVNGDLFFEELEFKSARAGGSGDRQQGGAICAALSSGSELRITGCEFNDLQANSGGAVYVNGGGLIISSAKFDDVISDNYDTETGSVYGTDLSTVRINNIDVRNGNAYGFCFSNCSADIEIGDINLQGNIGGGIYIEGGGGKREMHGISGNRSGVTVSGGTGDITITGSNFVSRGIHIYSSGASIQITNTEIRNNNSTPIFANGKNIVIENVVIENAMYVFAGMYLNSNGSIRISGSTIRGVKSTSSHSAGISLLGTGNAVISNTIIENIETITRDPEPGENLVPASGAIYANRTGDLTIIDCVINNVVSNKYGLQLTGSGNTVISNTTIKNINLGSDSYAIYASGRRLVISDTTIDNITAEYGVYGDNLTGVAISDLSLQDIGNGLYFTNCSGDVGINRIDLRNIASNGIVISAGIGGGSGKRELANITGYNIGSSCVSVTGGSGNITLTESSFDTTGQIQLFNAGASINISDVETKNVSSVYAIHTSAADTIIEKVKIENVPSGSGINMYASDMGQITDSSIKNCNLTIGYPFGGGGIYLNGSGSMVIFDTTIEDVEASTYGGAIYHSGSGNLTVIGSTIRNARLTGASSNYGGGISYYGSGSLEISDTLIENVEARSGGGIYAHTNVSHMNISNTAIENARAIFYGGGISFASGSTPFIITSSRFENCRADSGGSAVAFGSNGEVANTTFLNCTSRSGSKFMEIQGLVTFTGCTFEDNDALYRYDRDNRSLVPMFGQKSKYFENCTFTNLTNDNAAGERYIFTRFVNFTDPSMYGSGEATITLIRCTFNFRSGSVGLCALNNSVPYSTSGDYLLMDGVTINNNGGQQPLILLDGGSASYSPTFEGFRFKLNNVYNGTPLNTQAAITGLVSSGVMRLKNGAMPTIVP